MTNKPKATGTRAETAVVRFLVEQECAARREVLHGNKDHGDVHIKVGRHLIVLEVKSRKGWVSARQIEAWLTETDIEGLNAGADAGALVVKRPGSAKPADWLVYMRADEFAWLAYGHNGAPTTRWVCVDLAHFAALVRAA